MNGSSGTDRARRFGLLIFSVVALGVGCATPHSPTRVLPKATAQADAASGYVYDELIADSGLAKDANGKITGADAAWSKKALGRTIDLQQALDECEAERKALLGK